MDDNPYKSPLTVRERPKRTPRRRPSLWLALIIGAPVGVIAGWFVLLLLGR